MIVNRFKVLLAEKEIRGGQNWSYREIHEVTGVATRTLSDYTRNKVTHLDVVTLEALCQFFDCQGGGLLTPVTGN